MTTKIPESVISRTQREVYTIREEFQNARRKVEEAEQALEHAKNTLAFNVTNLTETCEFLDSVSPMDKDWTWIEEIEPSLNGTEITDHD